MKFFHEARKLQIIESKTIINENLSAYILNAIKTSTPAEPSICSSIDVFRIVVLLWLFSAGLLPEVPRNSTLPLSNLLFIEHKKLLFLRCDPITCDDLLQRCVKNLMVETVSVFHVKFQLNMTNPQAHKSSLLAGDDT